MKLHWLLSFNILVNFFPLISAKMDFVRIQFPFTQSDLLQLNKMVETAVERIYRSTPEERIPIFDIKSKYPILFADRPSREDLDANLTLQLEVYLHKHVKDSKTSFLYLTALCLHADKYFRDGTHGLNIPSHFTFMDKTRTFLPFGDGEGVLSVPTLTDTTPNVLITDATFMIRGDTLQYASDPFILYRQVITSQGMLSFTAVKENYEDKIVLTLADLHIDKDNLELDEQGIKWSDTTIFRSTPILAPVQSIKNKTETTLSVVSTSISSIPSVTTVAKSTVSSTITQALSVDTILTQQPLFSTGIEKSLNVGRVEILPPSALTSQSLARHYPPLTTRQRQAAQEGLKYPMILPPVKAKTVSRLDNPYYNSMIDSVREQLLKQTDDSLPKIGNLQVDYAKNVSPLAMSNENYVPEILHDVLVHQPPSVSIPEHMRKSLPNSVNSTHVEDVCDQLDNANTSHVSSYGSAHDVTIVEASAPPLSLVSTPSLNSSRTTRSVTNEIKKQWKPIILCHQRNLDDIGLVPVDPTEPASPKTLFVLPDRLTKFGTLLAAFMSIPENKEHWYFIEVLDSFFKMTLDNFWKFHIAPNNSANFENCQAIDSAHLVIHEKHSNDNELAKLATSFIAYETRTD